MHFPLLEYYIVDIIVCEFQELDSIFKVPEHVLTLGTYYFNVMKDSLFRKVSLICVLFVVVIQNWL